MDSINKNQPEHNHEDLSGEEAISQIKEIAEKAGVCFFCTTASAPASVGARPMAVQQVDDAGRIWFLSPDDSYKNEEVGEDPEVTLYFQGSSHANFLVLHGTTSISRDREKIEELWNPLIKTWFTEGKDDPRITVLCFTPREGHYWDTKHGNLVAGVKMMIGAMTGRTLDDSIEGRVSL